MIIKINLNTKNWRCDKVMSCLFESSNTLNHITKTDRMEDQKGVL